MLAILAQTAKELGPASIGFGAGGLTLGSLALFLVKRKLGKVCDHVDDQTKHIDPQNGYVRKSMCDRNFKELKEDIGNVNASVQILHGRIDRVLEKLN